MKKFLATLLAVVMVLSLCACGDEKNNTTPTSAPTTAATPTTAADPGTQTGPDMNAATTLTMWCIAVEGDANYPAYKQAIADLKVKYPNIELKWESIQNDDYKPKIKTAMGGGEVADIFFTWSCSFLGDFVEAGKVYCLDDEYKNFASDLDEKMCRNTTYNGKKYGVPLTMNVVTLFANMDMLKSVGVNEMPATYDELIACCDKLVAAGKIPFGCAAAAKQEWCITEYVEPILIKTLGGQKLDDIFRNGATWGDELVVKSIDTFQEMIKKGYFDPDCDGYDNDQVKANFIAGEYAFYQNGSWNCGELAEKPTFEVKATEFPVINSDNAKLGHLIGGPSDTLAVYGGSKNAAVAARYTFELGKLISKYGYLAGAGLPAWKVDYDDSKVNPLMQQVSKIVAGSDYMVLFGDTAMTSADATEYLKEIAKVFGGEVDGATFASDLKAALR